ISNTGMALYAENSFVGTWKTPTNSSSNFTITFTGIFGKEGFRFAFDAAGEDFYYETVKVGANQINIRLYLIDYETESYDLLATAQYSSATQTITLGSRELQCFDAFEGEWIVGNTTASSGEIAFAFDGRGLYGGEVTVSVEDGDDVTDVKVPYTYTTDGTGSFTYNGTTYNIWTGSQYGEKLIFIGVGDTATYLLYAADEYSGLRITGKYLDVTFDGTSNVNLGAKGYALIKTGGSQGLFRYDIDEDGDVTLYGSKDGQLVKVYRLDLNDDKLFELKQYNESGNSVDPTTVDTLGLFSYFLNLTWESMYPEEGADNSFVLESVNLDGIGKGTLYGEAITFEYYNPAVLFFNNGAYSMQYQGQDSYVTGMFNMNTGKAADIFIVYDDFLGEYTAANGDTLVMDGFGYSAGFFGEVAEAKLTIGEVETTYAYVILQGNAYLCNEEGNPVYIVCLVQPNGLPAVEFTDEDGNSVWLVSVADLS
ncbi:MAG: hypothetical protein K2N47_00580, partial [Clostridia bacterium]|nr:hypothetical protein [Clostridia bacterium]